MCEPWPTCRADRTCTGAMISDAGHCAAHASPADRDQWLRRVVSRGLPIDLRGVRVDPPLLSQVLELLPVHRMIHPGSRYGDRPYGHLRLDGATVIDPPPCRDAFLTVSARSTTFEPGWSAAGTVFAELDLSGSRARDLDLQGVDCLAGASFDGLTASSVDLREARVSGSLSLARVRLVELALAGLSVDSGLLDLSRSSIMGLWYEQLSIGGPVIVSGMSPPALAEGSIAYGQLIGADAETEGWLTRAGRQQAGDAIGPARRGWSSGGAEGGSTGGAAWAPEFAGDDPDRARWLTVEEWVGYTDRIDPDGGVRREGGVLGVRVARWPSVDGLGRLAFPEDEATEVPVFASALRAVLQEYRAAGSSDIRLGAVYACGGFVPRPIEGPLTAPELFEAIRGQLIDISADAWGAAQAAALAVLTPVGSADPVAEPPTEDIEPPTEDGETPPSDELDNSDDEWGRR